MDDKREVSEETRNGGAKAPFKFFHSSHQIVGSNPSDITAPTDKAVADFVNSSIATNSGRFQGTYETVGDLPLSGVRDNDYAFVVTVKPDGNPEYDRYKFSAQAGWMFEYRLNNSGFTAAQWAAITSGLSAADKARLDAMEDGAQANRIESVKVNGTAVEPVDKSVDIAVPTKTSDIENDSDFATNAGTVHKTGDETVMGVKTFGDSPVVPTVSMTSDSSGKAASTKWVGSKIAAWWDNLRKTAAVEFAQSVKAVGGFIGNLTGNVTGHASEDVPQTRKVNDHALSMDIELSASDVGALPDTTTHVSGDVPVTRKVNDYPLSTDITLTAADVKALPDTTVIPPAAKGSSYVDVSTEGVVSAKVPTDGTKGLVTTDTTQTITGYKTFENSTGIAFKVREGWGSNTAGVFLKKYGTLGLMMSFENMARFVIQGGINAATSIDISTPQNVANSGITLTAYSNKSRSTDLANITSGDTSSEEVATCGWVNGKYKVTEIAQGGNIVLTPDSSNPKKITVAAQIPKINVNGTEVPVIDQSVNIKAPQGTDETKSNANITSIRIVSSLPENPDANTIYFIRKNPSMPAYVVNLDSTLPSCSGTWAGTCSHETKTFNLSLPWNNEQQCFGTIESGDYLFFNSQESNWVFFLHTTKTEFLEIPGTDRDVSITETSSFSRTLNLNWSASA